VIHTLRLNCGKSTCRSVVTTRSHSWNAAAAAMGIPALINTRVDLYIMNVGDPANRFEETVRRGKAYLAAGADCSIRLALSTWRSIPG
jgi:2-methylisocitrate lyase-like PEP mutase family enzyme